MSDDISFSIRIVNQDGDGVSNEEVYITESGFLAGGSQSQITDTDGWATFEWTSRLTFHGTALVAGEEYEINLSDGESTSISIVVE